MNRRPTWIMLGLLAIALLVLAFMEWTPQGKQISQTPTPTNTPLLLSGWDPERITRVELSSPDQPVYILTRQDNGNWIITDNPSPVNQDSINSLLQTLTNTTIRATLSGDITQDATGLATPILNISLQDAFGATVRIKIGNQTPISSGYYAQVDGQAPVVASKYNIEDLLSLSSPDQLLSSTTP
jgi:hypothetical protein